MLKWAHYQTLAIVSLRPYCQRTHRKQTSIERIVLFAQDRKQKHEFIWQTSKAWKPCLIIIIVFTQTFYSVRWAFVQFLYKFTLYTKKMNAVIFLFETQNLNFRKSTFIYRARCQQDAGSIPDTYTVLKINKLIKLELGPPSLVDNWEATWFISSRSN